jgi:hypothetical protein
VPFDPIKKQELRVKNGHMVLVKLCFLYLHIIWKEEAKIQSRIKNKYSAMG